MPVSDTAASLVVERSPVGTGVLDSSGRFVQVNDALCALLRRDERGLLGRRPDQVGVLGDPHREAAERAALLAGRVGVLRREHPIVSPAGGHGWVDVLVSVLDPDPPPLLLLHAVDTTARHRVLTDLARQARTDPLTGLPNHREWRSRLDSRLPHVDPDRPLGLAMLHVRPGGDALLVGTVERWRDVVAWFTRDATLARLGAEEFGLLMPGLPELAAHATASRLVRSMAHGPDAGAGLTWAVPGDDARTLTERAAAALCLAENGRVVVLRGEPPHPLAATG